jgi:hypothetical protein
MLSAILTIVNLGLFALLASCTLVRSLRATTDWQRGRLLYHINLACIGSLGLAWIQLGVLTLLSGGRWYVGTRFVAPAIIGELLLGFGPLLLVRLVQKKFSYYTDRLPHVDPTGQITLP